MHAHGSNIDDDYITSGMFANAFSNDSVRNPITTLVDLRNCYIGLISDLPYPLTMTPCFSPILLFGRTTCDSSPGFELA